MLKINNNINSNQFNPYSTGNDQTLAEKANSFLQFESDLYFIDFGLSFVSGKIEDKAVDIYVLKRAFISTHPGSEDLFEIVIQRYKEIMSEEGDKHKGLKIVAKFREVELRGRKRECFG